MKKDVQKKMDDYLAGKLNPKEKTSFEKEMEKDLDLQKSFKLEQDLSILGDPSLGDFYQKMQQAEKRSLPRRRKLWPYYIAVASVAAILLIVLVNPFTSSPAFNNYFETYPMVLSQRGENDQQALVQAYQNQDWKRARPLLEDWQAQEPNNELVQLYLGVVALGAKDIPAAIGQLQGLEQKVGNVQEQARWYLALAYWEKGDLSASKSLLEMIIQKKTYRHEQATDLLKRL